MHLLAALGTFETPFVPVDIRHEYDGYSWADLPTIGRVELGAGKVLHESWLWSGKLICVESLTVAAHTSDGRVFHSAVCMAIPPAYTQPDRSAWEERVCVTPEARERLSPSEIWHHFGGWSDEGDTYDTQEQQFTEDLDLFWDQLVGPDEHLRRRLFEQVATLVNWQRITLTSDGQMVIQLQDGSQRVVTPPAPVIPPEVRPEDENE